MNIAMIMGTSIVKALILAIVAWLGYRWSEGKLDKPINRIKKFRKEYGLVTAFLIIVWWILTPSFGPDDVIAVWVWSQLGTPVYLMVVFGLTVYLLYRLKNLTKLWRKK